MELVVLFEKNSVCFDAGASVDRVQHAVHFDKDVVGQRVDAVGEQHIKNDAGGDPYRLSKHHQGPVGGAECALNAALQTTADHKRCGGCWGACDGRALHGRQHPEFEVSARLLPSSSVMAAVESSMCTPLLFRTMAPKTVLGLDENYPVTPLLTPARPPPPPPQPAIGIAPPSRVRSPFRRVKPSATGVFGALFVTSSL